jgi:hypothetical protein
MMPSDAPAKPNAITMHTNAYRNLRQRFNFKDEPNHGMPDVAERSPALKITLCSFKPFGNN